MSDTGAWPYGPSYTERERIGARADEILQGWVDEAMGDYVKLARAVRDLDSYDVELAVVSAIQRNSIGALHNEIEALIRLMWRDKAQKQAEGGG